MVDFLRLRERFLMDVCEKDMRIYKNSKYVEKQIRTGSVRKDNDHEPMARMNRSRCWEKGFYIAQKLGERRKNALQFVEDITLQKKDLYEQEQAFQQRFSEFNEQVTINEQKRERALASLKENSAYVRKRSEHVELLLKKILKLRQYKNKILEEIRKHLIYEEFLSSILYDFGSRASFYDVITRYCNLESKKRHLIARHLGMNNNLKTMCQESNDLIAEKLLHFFLHYLELLNRKKPKLEKLRVLNWIELERIMVYHEEVINMRTQISRHMVRYEEAVKRTSELECLQTNLWHACASRLEDIVLSVQGIRNLNEMINRRSLIQKKSFLCHVETEALPDLIHEIVNIKNTMGHLVLVMKKVETRLKIIRKLWGKEGYTIFAKSPLL